MKVPKCKECEFYINQKRREWYSFSDPYDNYCNAFKTTDKEGYQIGEKKFIYVKELKTSPKWCPKRGR